MEVMHRPTISELHLIPEDWEFKMFGELTEKIIGGGTPSRLNPKFWGNEIPWVTVKDITTFNAIQTQEYITREGLKKSASHLIPKGVIITSTRMALGKAVIYDVDVCINQDLKAIFTSKKIITKYLYFWFQLFSKDIENLGNGSTVMGISLSDLKKIMIKVPPIPEQQAIAEVLSDTDNLIQALEKQIAKKRLIKLGVMQELLTPKEGWETKTLKDVAIYRRGSFPQPYGLDKWYDDYNGSPFVQVFDVGDNMKLKSETNRKISIVAQRMSVFAKKGTLILTIQGSIGRIAITEYDAYIDRTLLVFESFLQSFDKYYFMLSISKLFEHEKKSAPGGIIKTITKEALSNFKISFPDALEQNRIATIVQNINSEIEVLEKKLCKYKSLKQGLMQNLLTGKIRLITNETV